MAKLIPFFLVAVMAVSASTGCGQKASVSEGDKKLDLSGPGGTTSVKQGETATVKVSITRTNFDEPVDITFSQLPAGVSIAEGSTKIEKGSREATFTLKADEKATPVAGHKAKLEASVGSMKAGPIEFTPEVNEKKKS